MMCGFVAIEKGILSFEDPLLLGKPNIKDTSLEATNLKLRKFSWPKILLSAKIPLTTELNLISGPGRRI